MSNCPIGLDDCSSCIHSEGGQCCYDEEEQDEEEFDKLSEEQKLKANHEESVLEEGRERDRARKNKGDKHEKRT